MILWLLGCAALVDNQPPELWAVNGVELHPEHGLPAHHLDLLVSPGSTFEITLDAESYSSHDLRIWWPWGPPGLSFDPDGLEGTWAVPADLDPQFRYEGLKVVLEDPYPPDPRYTVVRVPFWTVD